jgi:hypothetical protein
MRIPGRTYFFTVALGDRRAMMAEPPGGDDGGAIA